MRAGDLRHRIIIQPNTNTSDGMGGMTTTYPEKDWIRVWAAIWPVSATEQLATMKEIMIISHRIRIRYRSGIKPRWRIRFSDRYFNIVSIINPNEKNELLDLMCKEAM